MSNSFSSTLINYNKNKFSEPYKKYFFNYVKEDHYLYVTDEQGQSLLYETPYLQVYRNLHQHLDKYYLVLEISKEQEEDDVNKKIYNFKTMLDKIYGHSHEFIRKNFDTIFPKAQGKVDKYTLDTCIIRPFAGSNAQFIKILIPNEELAKKAYELQYEQEVKCTFAYNGLMKMKGGKLMEEYILYDIKTFGDRTRDELRRSISDYGTKYEVEIIKEEINKEHENYENNKNHEYIENKKEDDEFFENEENKINIEKINNEEMTENIEVQSIIEINENNQDYQKEMEEIREENENENLIDMNVKNKNDENKIEFMDGAIENKEKIKEEKDTKEKKNKKEMKSSKKEREKEKEKDKKRKDKLKKKLSIHKKNKNNDSDLENNSSEDENDNLSDNEEFHNLTDEMKKMIRKFNKKN